MLLDEAQELAPIELELLGRAVAAGEGWSPALAKVVAAGGG